MPVLGVSGAAIFFEQYRYPLMWTGIARLNYGMYLASIKGNYREAVEQWRELLKNNPDPNTAAHAREMITEAESRL